MIELSDDGWRWMVMEVDCARAKVMKARVSRFEVTTTKAAALIEWA